MFGFLGKIFGSEKAIGSAVGAVGRAFDALHYSDEEKAEVKMKLGNLIIDWIDKSKGMNLARRAIALGTLTIWLGCYVLAGLSSFLAIWFAGYPESARVIMFEKQALLFSSMADGLGGEVMLIFGFYFAAPHLGAFVNPAVEMMKRKFSKDKQ